MLFQFSRVTVVVTLQGKDYYREGKRWHFQFSGKGGKDFSMPAHHKAEEFMDAYVEAAGIHEEKKGPLFRKVDKQGALTLEPLNRWAVLKMVKRRAKKVGLSEKIGCHSFRATAITTHRQNGGTLDKARNLAKHRQLNTTQLYDHSGDEITLDEVERVAI